MTLAVRRPPELEQRLRSRAERTGRSKASYAREAIVRYLEDLEDERLVLERPEQSRPAEADGDSLTDCALSQRDLVASW